MGRKKKIELIQNEKIRTQTLQGRRITVVKKAMELSILCDSKIALVIKDKNDVFKYESTQDVVKQYAELVDKPHEKWCNTDVSYVFEN